MTSFKSGIDAAWAAIEEIVAPAERISALRAFLSSGAFLPPRGHKDPLLSRALHGAP